VIGGRRALGYWQWNCAAVTLHGVEGPRIIAIDWSGRSGRDQRRTLWLAETTDGQLVRLEMVGLAPRSSRHWLRRSNTIRA